MVTLSVRALLTPLLAALAALVVMVPRSPLRRKLGDALAWGTDPTSRAAVSSFVLGHMLKNARGPIVMVGHSQGGSILVDVLPRLRRKRKDFRLVTLGSGHGLLAAVEDVLPRWRLRDSAVLWLLTMCMAVAVAAMLPALLDVAAQFVRWVISTVAHLGSAVWLLGIDHRFAERQLEIVNQATWAGIAHSQVPALSPLIGLAGILPFVVVRSPAIREHARELRAATAIRVRGVDILATRDLVSACLLELGDAQRVREVRQCDSVLLDHVRYFRNGCVVLPLIIDEIEQAAGLHDAGPSEPPSGEGLL